MFVNINICVIGNAYRQCLKAAQAIYNYTLNSVYRTLTRCSWR